MDELVKLEEWVALIDACLEPTTKIRVAITERGVRTERPEPLSLDEAGVMGMGSTRDILLRATEREPCGLR